MDTEIDALTHPNGIWTTLKGLRLWYFPYLQRAERAKGKHRWLIAFNGGDVEVDLQRADTLIFHGATGALPLELLDECAHLGVSVIVQRTHIAMPFIGGGLIRPDRDDLLTRQILAREDTKKSSYIARQLIRHKLLAQAWIHAPSDATLQSVAQARNQEEIRLAEAQAAKRYWAAYFTSLGLDDTRRDEGDIQAALDTGSDYLSGIILRWVQAHALAPMHGFLHVPTHYPALVADLLEPYRYCIDRPIWEAYRQQGAITPAQGVEAIKVFLSQPVLVEPIRQRVYRRALLSGVVLALRHYLSGEMRRFLPPHEVDRVAGRKQICSYRLLGEIRA